MQVELKNITKTFGPVRANDNITLTVEGGSIQGLLGENGAGKSTLMKVLSGFISSDSGELILNKRSVQLVSPQDAIAHGVGMLHQDPLDFPPMRLIENFLVGCEGMGLETKSAETTFRDLATQFNFDLDPHAFVNEITVGERQQLEIIRLLWRGVETLILDEPTTGISAPQKVLLFATLKKLAQSGKSIIFVSHKLEDVEKLCDNVAVLRQGKLVAEMTRPFDIEALVTSMFGQVMTTSARPSVPLGKPLLQLSSLTLTDYRMTMNEVNASVQAGEVIGVAGLEGSGQRLLMQACAGLLRPKSGTIQIDSQNLTGKTYPAYAAAGVAFMPADRMAEGLVEGLTIAEHVVLARRLRQKKQDRARLIAWDEANMTASADIAEFNIKGRPDSTVESLSGGNQQRTLLALLPDQLRLLIMEHPTRGLDVESAQYIWGKLLARREDGTAIMFSSADLDEVFQYSDRIWVCFDGQIIADIPTSDTTIEALGYLIGGKKLPNTDQ